MTKPIKHLRKPESPRKKKSKRLSWRGFLTVAICEAPHREDYFAVFAQAVPVRVAQMSEAAAGDGEMALAIFWIWRYGMVWDGFVFLVIFYFWHYQKCFIGNMFFYFGGFLKQIQVWDGIFWKGSEGNTWSKWVENETPIGGPVTTS